MAWKAPWLVTGERADPVVSCTKDEDMARQADKDACDINRIVRQYVNGQIPLPEGQGVYGDFTSGSEYREVLDRARNLQEWFGGLPAEMRHRYDNDPAVFLDRIGQEEFKEDAILLGLREKEVPDVPVAHPTPA